MERGSYLFPLTTPLVLTGAQGPGGRKKGGGTEIPSFRKEKGFRKRGTEGVGVGEGGGGKRVMCLERSATK